jgi:hypothetical protein
MTPGNLLVFVIFWQWLDSRGEYTPQEKISMEMVVFIEFENTSFNIQVIAENELDGLDKVRTLWNNLVQQNVWKIEATIDEELIFYRGKYDSETFN